MSDLLGHPGEQSRGIGRAAAGRLAERGTTVLIGTRVQRQGDEAAAGSVQVRDSL